MKKLISFTALLFCYSIIKAQEKNYHISLEAQGIGTTSGVVPFWLRSNQYGSIPLSGGSGSFIGRIRKDYDSTKTFTWSASFEGRANIGKQTQFDLIEGVVKGRAGIFEIKAGRSKDVIGLVDTALTSGSFANSGNALGIPKVAISIPNFYSLPFFGKLFAVKGSIASGFAGKIGVQNSTAKENSTDAYYLENMLYGRVGKPDWRFKFYAGYNHEAIWGNERNIFGPSFNLPGATTFWYVLTGKVFHASKVGNHLGSLDVGGEYRFDALTLFLYRQSFYDVGALSSLANIKDGLNGISLTNNKPRSGNFYWKKVLFELLYTANQAGYADAKRTKSGAENYYNNYEYTQGWAYQSIGLGTPFITSILDARKDLPRAPSQFFINNRLLAFHAATQISISNWSYTGKVSYSVNYGTFASGDAYYRSMRGALIGPSGNGVFKTVNQLSTYIEGVRPLKNGYNIGYDIGYDNGGLLYNSFGLILKVSKSFL
jgi:hypothetical protein